MESKIEKLKGKYYIYPKNSKDEVVEYLNALCKKQNEIIDHLNSQSQPEEMLEDRIERARKKREECLKRFEDTPEEKGELKQFEEFLEDLVVGEGDDMDNLYLHSTEREEIMEKVKQLLKEREREVLEDIKGVNNEVYEGRTEILEVEIDNRLDKLNKEEK